uniref:Uncharacterized protein n=1 Tax=Arundo donax TaxID=35708 RepID=A0A0A9G5F7_ARUDO
MAMAELKVKKAKPSAVSQEKPPPS